jgi:hypothetical protein
MPTPPAYYTTVHTTNDTYYTSMVINGNYSWSQVIGLYHHLPWSKWMSKINKWKPQVPTKWKYLPTGH